MFHYKSNTLSVYFFLLFFKLITAATFATAQGAGGPDPNPTTSIPPNNRATHYNQIGWYAFFGTIKLSGKWSLHTEYQFRRNNLVTDWQQGLFRVGINYQVNPRVLLRLGYAMAETYAYGDIPINALGRSFTEHRLYQMAQLSHKEGWLELQHRFMLEQRFVGRYSSAAVEKEDEFPFMHRARYMIRLQAPLKGREIKDKTAYAAVYNEIMIGFGKNVTANIFDQNRIGLLLGYRFSKSLRIEAGYLNQTLQFGRLINGRNIFQSNSGLIVNTNFSF
ncbi:MAG: DUF2490 domain-containing protein [Sediminibacterium sp.]|jgi:opacity protein-like surface antigen|uniref:DUF2490 domain-containing protein n=1 Tax=Sediminibacterium sp. TaxID=1917865 RepID=UPI00272242CC|nr:DUF2490 domain-containing protein [Sediminibacterium sp.]MDO8997169.1 DUF2490 domain-containing protein [Sediminibacterium sp.]